MALHPYGFIYAKTWECAGSHCAGGTPARLTWSCAGGCSEVWGARQMGWYAAGSAAYCPTCTRRSPCYVKQMRRWLISAAEDERYCSRCKPQENPLNLHEADGDGGPPGLAGAPGFGAGAAAAAAAALQDIGGGAAAAAAGADGGAAATGHYNCAGCDATIDGTCPREQCDPLWVARAHGWLPSKNKLSYCPTCVQRYGTFYTDKSRKFMQQAKDDDRLCGGCAPPQFQ